MSHGNMTMAQAKELQKRYNCQIKLVELAEDQRVTQHKPTVGLGDINLVLHRNGTQDVSMQATVVVMKSRKTRTGVESYVIQKFKL